LSLCPLITISIINTFIPLSNPGKMVQNTALERPDINDKLTGINFNDKFLSADRSARNSVIDTFLPEGGDDFSQYLNLTGLAGEHNSMVISSMHHYYYDYNDLKGIRTLINLKQLNQVTHLESFLHTLYRILPCQANFVGCFKNSNNNDRKRSVLRPAGFFNRVASIFDSGMDRNLSATGIPKLLEEHGFKLIDLTEINGRTYFWARNIRRLGD